MTINAHYHRQILHDRFWRSPALTLLSLDRGELSQLIKLLPTSMQQKLLFGRASKKFLGRLETLPRFWQIGWNAYGIDESDFKRGLGNLRVYWGYDENQCCLALDLIFRAMNYLLSSAETQTPEREKYQAAETGCAFLRELDVMLNFHQSHPLAPVKKLVELRI